MAKLIPCALCQVEAATLYCVNDDANLCASCDASVHAANPLLARHERRPLAACAGECASAACGPASTDCADVAVVPEAPLRAVPELQPAVDQPGSHFAAPPAQLLEAAPPAPLALYEDAFFARSLTTSDLLDMDADELELPAFSSTPGFACFDPLEDGVVPSFDRFAPAGTSGVQQPSYYGQPTYVPSYLKQQPALPGKLVPLGGAPAAGPKPVQAAADPEAEAARVQRHRDRQRKKRAFGRTVRYASRRAYAEIRPRIKGRFVTPEEYALYQAQQAAAGLPLEDAEEGACGEGPADAAPAEEALPTHSEDAQVVPMPPPAMVMA